MKRKVLSLVLAAVMIISLAACGGDSSSGSSSNDNSSTTAADNNSSDNSNDNSDSTAAAVSSGAQADKVVVGLTESSFQIAPFGSSSGPRAWMIQNMYASLYCMPYYGASLDEMESWLAKSVEKVDDLTYSVELYDYIYDSKGNQITSEDIVFSYERLKVDSQETRIGTYLKEIEVVDDYNMLFHLNKSGPGVVEFLVGNYTLSICDKEWYENASEEERSNDPATTGAYRVVSHTSGSSVVLEANDDYWQKDESLRNSADVQNVKTIEYKVISENSMRSVALENGEIDVTVIDASELKRFYDGSEALDGWTVRIGDGTMCYTAFINMDPGMSELADNLNLRLAALYALDSESILYGGDYDNSTGEVAYSFGASSMAGYQDSWASDDYFTYNVETAREYYQASGYAEGEVTIRLLSRTSIVDGIHSVMIANLEAAGFKVELLSYDQALFNTYKNDSTQWDMMLDNKGSTGHIATCWDNNFNPAGFANGSVNFTKDDHLVELLTTVTTSGADEDVITFHEYLKELAGVKGLFSINSLTISQDGITKIALNGNMQPRVNAFEFADDYKSVAD